MSFGWRLVVYLEIQSKVFDCSPDPQTIAKKSLENLKMCQAEAAKG